ncbi:type III-B CRISPR module-associated protein Cmr3 [Methylohalobius crimeensis]|uniref:type III-B CRISPR module-associated protein Cmr3 n=1 Tax=Methylohalobius crimeensis TaxID=244365 RepID=UPI0003B6C67F|nr:type III-B CRISPR module-associated protein Cmr3 [Methylohalobius crimeensis]
MNTWHFIEPLDVLYLRGNKLFGDPGSYGEALIPPWPSIAAGALRSLLLARSGTDLAAFADGKKKHPELGTPNQPGPFRVTDFLLARRYADTKESLHPIPADLMVSKDDEDEIHIHPLSPHELGHGIQCSAALPKVAVLAENQRSKPASGFWLKQAGYERYLAGELPAAQDLVATRELWQMDERIGIGLDSARRRADDGKLFSVQAVAFRNGVGFLAGTQGAELPRRDMLRLGGDGRAAAFRQTDYRPPRVAADTLLSAGRCRIVLTTPGLFADGWRLPGMTADGQFELAGVRGQVVAAAVPRAETISGWDLARWQPKPALRAAPAGSVYWIDNLSATSESLTRLADRGLWPENEAEGSRRVEGFNRFAWAV